MSSPIIFLACANHFLKRKGKWMSLNYLKQEIVELTEKLQGLAHATPVMEGDESEYAYEILTGGKFMEDIAVFHLSGKLTDSEKITFDAGDNVPIELSLEQVGLLLKAFPRLSVVTLNGLATKELVVSLLNAGIPSVLATTRTTASESKPQETVQKIYEALGAGHSLKDAIGESIGQKQADEVITDKEDVRYLSLGYQREEGELPWGLYFKEAFRKILDRTLSDPEIISESEPETGQFSFKTGKSQKGIATWKILAIIVGVLMALIAFF
jgi:hypothetical protein